MELHFAHGYLGQSFFSVHSNQRTDAYGCNIEGRSLFLLDMLTAVRDVSPEHLPLTANFGALELDGRDDEALTESIELARAFRRGGLDLLNVSVCFSTLTANILWGPAFLAPAAERARREAELPVASSWGLGNMLVADRVIAKNQMDLVMVGRIHLANPQWPYQAAQKPGAEKPS